MGRHDAGTRLSKNAPTPPPLYLRSGQEVPYCHTCGRVMNIRQSQPNNIVKYCSDRCRNRRPGKLDRQIERTIVQLLNGDEESSNAANTAVNQTHTSKTNARRLVSCDEVEDMIFGSNRIDERASSLEPETNHIVGVPQYSDSPQTDTAGITSQKEKQKSGQQRAEQRELVRRAARRGVIFGFSPSDIDDGDATSNVDRRRKCEAVIDGKVVEPSFAKGNWTVRWRE